MLIPEVPYNPEQLAHLLSLDKKQTPANYAVLLVCDGAQPQAESQQKYQAVLDMVAGKPLSSSGLAAAALLKHLTGEEIFHQELTYLLRTGAPDGQDLLGALNFAFTTAALVDQGVYGRMAAFKQNTMWTHISLEEAAQRIKTVDADRWYDRENYQPRLDLIWSVENL